MIFAFIAWVFISTTCYAGCMLYQFTDFEGNPFFVSTRFKCLTEVFFTCVDGVCAPNAANIFDQAVANTGWHWERPECNGYDYNSGHPKSDDMVCSDLGNNVFHTLFDPVCKIHDMCLRTDGRTSSQCHTAFAAGMVTLCAMQHPLDIEVAGYTICLTTAATFKAAADEFGNAHGGIDGEACKLALPQPSESDGMVPVPLLLVLLCFYCVLNFFYFKKHGCWCCKRVKYEAVQMVDSEDEVQIVDY